MVRLNKLFASVESALSVAEQYDTNATKEQLRALDSAIDASLIALSDLKELVPGEPKPRPDSGETKLEDYAIQIKAELKKNTSPDFDVKKLKRYLIDSKQIVAEDCKGYIERLNWAEVMLTEKLTPDLLSSPILKALVDPNATSESNATEKVDSSKQSSLASHPWITHEGLEQVLHQKEKASDTANQTSVPDARKKSGLANNPWIKAGQDPQNTEGPAINQKARDEFVAKRLKKQKSVDEFVAKRLKKFESYSEEDRQREEMIRWKVLRRCFTNVERQIAKHNDIPSLESLRPLPSYLSGMEMNLRQLEALTGADFRKEISRVNSIGHDIHAAYETNQAVFALTLLTEDLANIKEKVAGIAKAREAAGNGLLQNPFLKDMQQEAEKK
jgi:hypothetical protein